MSTIIQNPSRGTADPSEDEPTGVKALDPLRFSLRETVDYVNLASIQMTVGFAKTHAIGEDYFQNLLPRTTLSSVLARSGFSSSATFSVSPPAVTIEKTDDVPQPSTYITSVDGGDRQPRSAMVTAIIERGTVAQFTLGDDDPVGPVLALEHGSRRTAAFVFFLEDNLANSVIRVCGPSVDGVRSPDVYFPNPWGLGIAAQYVLVWNEEQSLVQLYTDDSLGTGFISEPRLIAAVPMSTFQVFGAGGSVQRGSNNDISAYYGVEGENGNSVSIEEISIAVDVGQPFINGVRPGNWRTFLDGDSVMGFSGAVDPTRLRRGGAWFPNTTNTDTEGSITPVQAGYCRITKETASSRFSVYRHEKGFERTATDGLVVEFKVAVTTTGGLGSGTGGAIKISDGQSVFQLDFLDDGATRNIGVLRLGGDPSSPASHLIGTTAIDYQNRTLRFTVDPRRGVMEMFDTEDLVAPLAAWALDRLVLPVTADSDISVGLGELGNGAVGTFDIHSLRYSYLYQAWEARDAIDPTAADPSYSSVGAGAASLTDEGLEVVCDPGERYTFARPVVDGLAGRGGVFEACLKITDWHPTSRTGVLIMLDDGERAYILSFVETLSGKFACIALSDGASGFQEMAGQIGEAAKFSVLIDWTEFHTYRIERRARDGVYLFIDDDPEPALVLSDSSRYSFPLPQYGGTPAVAFGSYTDEGGTSVWKFARCSFGSGFEISTILNLSETEVRRRLDNARAMVLITAGE